MHSVMVIAGGMALLAAFLIFGSLVGANAQRMTLWFLPAWLICATVNLYIGVTQAGYTIAQELPILVVIFAVPAAAALIVRFMTTR